MKKLIPLLSFIFVLSCVGPFRDALRTYDPTAEGDSVVDNPESSIVPPPNINTNYTLCWYENFDCTSLSTVGFTDINYWKKHTQSGQNFMKSTTPGGAVLSSVCRTNLIFSRSHATNGVSVKYKICFDNSVGSNWREQNQLWFSLYDQNGNETYKFLFKPNTSSDTNSTFQMKLTSGGNTVSEANTGLVTPNWKWLNFELYFYKNGNIKVKYNNHYGPVAEYINCWNSDSMHFEKIKIEYKTGTGSENYNVLVDEIEIKEF